MKDVNKRHDNARLGPQVGKDVNVTVVTLSQPFRQKNPVV